MENITSYIRTHSSDTLFAYLIFVNKMISIDTNLEIAVIKEISFIRNGIIHNNSKFELKSMHNNNNSLTLEKAKEYMLFLSNYLISVKNQIKIKHE